MARLLRLLPDSASPHELRSVDPSKIAFVSLAAMANQAKPLRGVTPSRRSKVCRSGRSWFTDWALAHVRTSGGPTSPTQRLFRVARSSPNLCARPSLTRSNRRGTDPYARWCGRGGVARRPPIPIVDVERTWRVTTANGSIGRRAGLHGMPRAGPESAPLRAFHCEREIAFAAGSGRSIFFRPSCASTARRGCWFQLQICKMPALCHPKGTSWYKNNVMSYYFAHNSIMHDAVVFHEADLPNCRGAGIPCPVRAASFPSGDCACRPPH